jgi:hypothetical protein
LICFTHRYQRPDVARSSRTGVPTLLAAAAGLWASTPTRLARIWCWWAIPRFKALELAARAHVPRQKIYEVLDSLVEKGFAQVVQERTKLFSAVPPDQAIHSYLSAVRRRCSTSLPNNRRTRR